ncbi:pyridoxamine 5'-phosphate oxidase family protein [Brevibacillus laterosporus]|uniref:pyridoxamine 5'-phosphate oxidase family protein n=1 Tax=Brevibacillus laterosporus TaxID=1465 RepID=UPI003D1C4C9D
MAETVAQSLSEELFEYLQHERYVTVGSIDYETKAPVLSAISWVVALDNHTIRIALDSRSRILTNVSQDPKVVLNLIGCGSTYAINGIANIIADKMEGVPLKLGMLEVKIESVRDIMFYGSRISVEPQYEKTYDQNAAAKLDQQVMTALRTLAIT